MSYQPSPTRWDGTYGRLATFRTAQAHGNSDIRRRDFTFDWMPQGSRTRLWNESSGQLYQLPQFADVVEAGVVEHVYSALTPKVSSSVLAEIATHIYSAAVPEVRNEVAVESPVVDHTYTALAPQVQARVAPGSVAHIYSANATQVQVSVEPAAVQHTYSARTPFVRGRIFVGAADFNGSTNYMTFSGALTGLADGKQGAFYGRIKINSGDGTTRRLFSLLVDGGNHFTFAISAANVWAVFGQGTDGSAALQAAGTGTILAGTGWHRVAATWDLTDSAKFQVWVDGVEGHAAPTTYRNVNINYASASVSRIGALASDASQKLPACLAEFWFDDTWVNFNSTLSAFEDSQGFPMDLGTDGSAPTGSAPVVYCHLDRGEAVANFALNRGAGQDFTTTGTLAACNTNPGDYILSVGQVTHTYSAVAPAVTNATIVSAPTVVHTYSGIVPSVVEGGGGGATNRFRTLMGVGE